MSSGKPPDSKPPAGNLRDDQPLAEGSPPNVTGAISPPAGEKNPVQRLMNGPVVVWAGGIEYHGTLTGADEESLWIMTQSGPKQIPFGRVNKVFHPDHRETLDSNSPLSREFFEDDTDKDPDSGA